MANFNPRLKILISKKLPIAFPIKTKINIKKSFGLNIVVLSFILYILHTRKCNIFSNKGKKERKKIVQDYTNINDSKLVQKSSV